LLRACAIITLMGSELNIPQLTIERSVQDGVHVIALIGEFDLHAVGEFEAALGAAGDEAQICLDLTALQFIDSTGLATVIRAHQALGRGGGALAVACGGEGSVRRTFETTGLMTLLTVTADRAAALAALA
jgi:anti-sigma B factor antagonist